MNDEIMFGGSRGSWKKVMLMKWAKEQILVGKKVLILRPGAFLSIELIYSIAKELEMPVEFLLKELLECDFCKKYLEQVENGLVPADCNCPVHGSSIAHKVLAVLGSSTCSLQKKVVTTEEWKKIHSEHLDSRKTTGFDVESFGKPHEDWFWLCCPCGSKHLTDKLKAKG